VRAFVALLQSHSAATRCFSRRLQDDHGLSLSEYEVLLRLARAPDRRLKRVELVERVLLTPSGITRLLDRLEREGLVCRAGCSTDARVTYAVLTDAGMAKVEVASDSHLAQLQSAFGGAFSPAELCRLAELLARVGPAVGSGHG
jgi:MarR family transcriptional regulator, 2-MHQ and catechol-resistance regulon repressor